MEASTMLEKLKQQHANFIMQRDLAQNNLNQLIGAIYACELMIKKCEEEAMDSEPVQMAVMD